MISSSSAPPTRESLARVLAFLRAGIASTADEVRPIDAGLVVSAPSLSAVWSLNQIRVTEPLTFDSLVELAEELQAGLPYRQIAVEHQHAGPKLEDAFRAAGWKVDRDRLMVMSAAPDREADTSVAVDAGEEEVLELMRRWHDEDDPGPRELEELVAYSLRESRVHGDRLLGVRSSDGRLVAISKLRSDGRTAQVEDVYTVPEARGRGFARALVSRAVELARDGGDDLIFITADDQDWPKLLYGRLGFRPIGRVWQFHRHH